MPDDHHYHGDHDSTRNDRALDIVHNATYITYD